MNDRPKATPAASQEAETTMRRLRHDMRTPLGQIIGYSEMLEEEVEERGQNDLIPDLQKIRGAARSLLGLVEEIFETEALPSPGQGSADSDAHTNSSAEVADSGALDTGDTSSDRPTVTGTLLVVDDDPGNRDMLARRLERTGYQVEIAADGRSALHLLEQQDIDLVLLDVLMPGMSGLEVLQAIRQSRSRTELPVIMATALDRSDDTVQALRLGANDYVTKPFDYPVVLARVDTQIVLKRAAQAIVSLAQQLEIRNAFVRRTFGRYVSDEVVESVLSSEEGLELRGERRKVTILLSDLRGFTTLTESLEPMDVVSLLNNQLGTMAEVVQEYDGTVDEFIGDAVLALFGAPVSRDDDTERAVACAVAMQRAMEGVNERNRARGLPEVEMGIGLATGEVIVGNVGSEKRSKYTAVGSAVNLTSRIESYSLGGEILVSEEIREELGDLISIDREREVHPKGFDVPLRIYRIVGIAGKYPLQVPRVEEGFVRLEKEIPIRFALLEGKSVGAKLLAGNICELSVRGARIRASEPMSELADIRILLGGDDAGDACYAKVVEATPESGDTFTVRFTTRPEALEALLRALRSEAADS